MFDKDKLNNIPVKLAATSTMHLIDAIQLMPADQQVFAVTAAFKLLTERFNVNPQDAFAVAHNVMHDADGKRLEFRGIQLYLENEL